MPDREPLARVEYQAPDRFGAPATWVVDFCGRREYFPKEEYANERAGEVNAAYFSALDIEVKKAVDAERERCCKTICDACAAGHPLLEAHDYGQFVHTNMYRCEASAIRSAPGKEKP